MPFRVYAREGVVEPPGNETVRHPETTDVYRVQDEGLGVGTLKQLVSVFRVSV